MFASRPTATPYSLIYFNTGNTFEYDEGSISFATTQLFRDPAAWYHIVLAVDTTQATSSNRFKVYINGQYISTNLRTVVQSGSNITVTFSGLEFPIDSNDQVVLVGKFS
jgi:hypothetical protein